MENLSEVLNALDLEPPAKDVIAKVLNQLDDKIVSSFIEDLKITNRKVAGTCYAGVKDTLSKADFISLYEALGYNFAQEAIWSDHGCTYQDRCVPMKTFTCNPDTCFPKH